MIGGLASRGLNFLVPGAGTLANIAGNAYYGQGPLAGVAQGVRGLFQGTGSQYGNAFNPGFTYGQSSNMYGIPDVGQGGLNQYMGLTAIDPFTGAPIQGNVGQGRGVGSGLGGPSGTSVASTGYAGGFSGGSASRGTGALAYKKLAEATKKTV